MPPRHIELGKTPEEMAEMNPEPLRSMERKVDGVWTSCRMKDIKVSDVFIFTDDPEVKYIALENPFVNEEYKWSIKAKLWEIKNVTEE